MSAPFFGEIRQFPYSFAPFDFAYCNGDMLNVSQNAALFALLGTTYGGNGKTTFALPNLQGRALMHQGSGPGLTPRTLGEAGGSAAVTLAQIQMPAHNHSVTAKTATPAAVTDAGVGAYLSLSPGQPSYSQDVNHLVQLAPNMLSPVGGEGDHENRQPYLTMAFCIALRGMFPARD